MLKSGGWVCLSVLVAACGVPEARHGSVARTPPLQSAPTSAVAGAVGVAYRIDPMQSEMRVLVYRAGPMARLGHNHVIVNRAIDGWVKLFGRPETAKISLRIRAEGFVVDDPGARREEGVDFVEAVADDATLATRHNMLGSALLAADVFPTITLDSVAITAAPASVSAGSAPVTVPARAPNILNARMSVRVAGHDSTIDVPFAAEATASRVSGSGTVSLRQTDLGLTPFSIMLGALKVQDDITIKFKLVADAS